MAPEDTQRPDFYTLNDAADFLHVSRTTLYRWAQEGYVEAQKVRGRWRFRGSDLVAFLAHDTSAVTP